MIELYRAKYPLAILAKALEVLEERFANGGDINCGFSITAQRSSLASAIREKKVSFPVNAFHGYSHNFICQLKNHPNGFKGIGLDDLETMERIFSGSNALAALLRFASAYPRGLFITTYFGQWDEDKYANLGTFILNNYLQALEILDRDPAALEDSKQRFNVTEEDMDRWEKEQETFFQELGKEPENTSLQVEYVALLQALHEARTEKESAESSYYGSLTNSAFITETPGSSTRQYSGAVSATLRMETRRRVARERCDNLLHDIVEMEARLCITQRWAPGDPIYIETMKYIAERNYHRAVDRVHELVVKRLFELQKLNIAGTGKLFI